jgi:hypothetical protein
MICNPFRCRQYPSSGCARTISAAVHFGSCEEEERRGIKELLASEIVDTVARAIELVVGCSWGNLDPETGNDGPPTALAHLIS